MDGWMDCEVGREGKGREKKPFDTFKKKRTTGVVAGAYYFLLLRTQGEERWRLDSLFNLDFGGGGGGVDKPPPPLPPNVRLLFYTTFPFGSG